MRAACLCLTLLLAGPVLAQDVTLEPSAAQRCLTPTAERRGTPEYPPVAFKRGQAGRAKVELLFDASDRRPEVKVLAQEGDDSFVDAVKAHVREYRVPCLGNAEAPTRLVIDFVFAPDKREARWSSPLDANAAERTRMLSCMQHQSGAKAPPYPIGARRAHLQGRVLARLRFTAADQPPSVETFARPRAALLADEISEWVQGYRMPCFGGEPLEAVQSFVFVFEGDSYGFKQALTLPQLLPSVRGIRSQTVNFDTREMACPFDLKFMYRRPYLPNGVGELAPEGGSTAPPAGPNPARRPFLDWLAQIELDVPEGTLDSVFGDKVTLSVPCVKINLTPKE